MTPPFIGIFSGCFETYHKNACMDSSETNDYLVVCTLVYRVLYFIAGGNYCFVSWGTVLECISKAQ